MIELLITLSVLGIIATLGAPQLRVFILNMQMTAQANALASDVQTARSEAGRRNVTVTLCGSADGVTCNGTWKDGRIIFVDADSDGSIGAGEELLRASPGMSGAAVVSVAGLNAGTLLFSSTGQANAVGSIGICDGRPGNFGRTVAISATGRPSVSTRAC